MRERIRALSNHVRHAHRIEDTGMGRDWRGQIDVTIEVHQAEVPGVAEIACKDTKGDGTISSDDDWRQVLLEYLIHSISHSVGNFNHTQEVLLLPIRAPWLIESQRQITKIDDLDPAPLHSCDQTSTTQCLGGLFLPYSVRSGTGRDSDESDLGEHTSSRLFLQGYLSFTRKTNRRISMF